MFDTPPDVFENVAPEHRPNGRPAAPVGATPDGLGAYARPTSGTGEYFQPGPSAGAASGMGAYAVPTNGMGGELAFLEPLDASPAAAMRTAGITALVAAVAFGSGLALGGAWGGVSGIMFSGSAFNIYRAQKWWGSPDASEKSEAVVSALFGAIGIAAGGYAGYKAYLTK